MKNLISWIDKYIRPLNEKVANNAWLMTIQGSFFKLMPLILVGSIGSLIGTLRAQFSFLPDLTQMNNFSMGLLGLFLAFYFPYSLMEKKGLNQYKVLGGLTTIAMYFILVKPEFGETTVLDFSRMGGGGIIVAILVGTITAYTFNVYSKFKFVTNKTALPDYVYEWFVSIIPECLLIGVTTFIAFNLNYDVFNFIQSLTTPLINIGQTLPGYVLMWALPCFFYSFGLTPWAFFPIIMVTLTTAMDTNAALVAQGMAAQSINTWESQMFLIGGSGLTFMLNIFMLRAKSQKLKVMGKVTLVPSLFSINEPIVYGLPIALNPILMIPFVLNGFLMPIVIYLAQSSNILHVFFSESVFAYNNLPIVIKQFLVGGSDALILLAIVMILSGLIYYPFFKVYDKQCLKEENHEQVAN